MEQEKSLPIADDTEKVEPALTDIPKEKRCLNCDTPLTDLYCSHCGQKAIASRQTIGELLINFISSFWSFESKFLRTGKYLLFKPGKLAIDYNAGRRERYFHPARLYVFISFVFFLLASVLPDDDKEEFVKYSNQNSEEFSIDAFDTVVGKYKTKAQYDSAQLALPENKRDGFWMRKIREREIHINQRYKGKGKEFNDAFTDNYAANVPKIFFLLLPVFALILKGLYIRRDYYYSEHLVFTIYYYNFFFLTGCIYLVIGAIPYGDTVSWLLIIWMFLYLLLAMKFMYKQSWLKTIFKYGALFFIFCLCVVIALFVNLAISLMYL